MAKFLIEPHFRLQEWVAEEKNYFRKEGIYQRHRYAKQVQETFELWSWHVEALTTK